MPTDPLFILWFFVLPLVGIFFLVFAPIFWFLLVPKLARKFTWARFRNTTVIPVAHAEGYVEFEFAKKSLHEGVLDVGKNIYRLLPRPLSKATSKHKENLEEKERIEEAALRKYIIKDFGKPIVFGYAGKAGVVNPEVIANLSGTVEQQGNPWNFFVLIKKYIEDELPKKHHNPLNTYLDKIHDGIKNAIRTIPLINLDLETLKEYLHEMYMPSQVKAISETSYSLGQATKDRDLLKIGFLALAIIALLILGIVAFTQL